MLLCSDMNKKENQAEDSYLDKIDSFMIEYGYNKNNKNDVLTDNTNKFRYHCYKYLNVIRENKVKDIPESSQFEAVLIEFRKFPHIEFVIRNTIDKLSNNWAHTIVCGNIITGQNNFWTFGYNCTFLQS